MRRFGQHQHLRRCATGGFTLQLQGQGCARCAEQPQLHRNHKRLFARLAGRGGAALGQRERVTARGGVIHARSAHAGRASLAVPALELGQMLRQRAGGVGIGNRLHKVIAGHGLAVVALEVQLHALGKTVAAHQVVLHAHYLGAFFVDGDGVEVVDLDVAVRPHRVGHGACVFGELGGAQHAHVFDALDGAGRGAARQVHAEFLVTEDGETFLQAQLEPVAAGHAVARPVVEVLVAHHAFDVGEVGIGGGGFAGQNVLRVEDVQALVLHGTHVEVAGSDDHEALQVQRQAKAGFVPCNARHQRVHGVLGLAQIAGAHIHLQQVVGARAGADFLLARHQLARHQGEQVAGLLVRVHPLGKVAAVFQVAAVHQVAVAQQHGVLRLVGPQRHAVAGHHIRAVQEVGDAAETLGLALGEERIVAHVQAHELGVLGWCAGGEDFERERVSAFGQVFQHQLAAVHLERGALAVDQHAGQVQVFAVQAQRLRGHVGVAAQRHAVEHTGLGGVQVERELDAVDPIGGGGVVFAADGYRRGLSIFFRQLQHGCSPESRCS